MVNIQLCVVLSYLFLTEAIKEDFLLARITQHITLLITSALSKVKHKHPLSIKQLTA